MISEDARNRTVALYAPSKTFNLAGMIGSYHIIYNKWLRDRIEKESSLPHYNGMNVLSMHALIGAYKPEGYEWVDELKQVLTKNVAYACDYIENHFEGIRVSRPQGTYMLFLDCTDWCNAHDKTIDELLKIGWDIGVAWQDGRAFHGPCHIRMNLALPLSRVQEAFDRLQKYVFIRRGKSPSDILQKTPENVHFSESSGVLNSFFSRKLHSHTTVANLTFTFQDWFAKQRCIASNYGSSASFRLDSLSFQPSVF